MKYRSTATFGDLSERVVSYLAKFLTTYATIFSVFNTRYFCLPYNVLVFSLLTLECLALKCRQ